MKQETKDILIKMMGAIVVVVFILAAVSQCQVGAAEAEARAAVARGAVLEEQLADQKVKIEDQTVLVMALRDTTNVMRTETVRVVTQAAEFRRRTTLRVDELLSEGEAVAGDSVATVMVIQGLRQHIDSLNTSHVAEVETLTDINVILWRRIESTDLLLDGQIERGDLAEDALSEYRAGAERALDALRAYQRRDRYIKIALVAGTAIVLGRSVLGN
jgi:hypothetical protein